MTRSISRHPLSSSCTTSHPWRHPSCSSPSIILLTAYLLTTLASPPSLSHANMNLASYAMGWVATLIVSFTRISLCRLCPQLTPLACSAGSRYTFHYRILFTAQLELLCKPPCGGVQDPTKYGMSGCSADPPRPICTTPLADPRLWGSDTHKYPSLSFPVPLPDHLLLLSKCTPGCANGQFSQVKESEANVCMLSSRSV